MQKFLFLGLLALLLSACGGNTQSATEENGDAMKPIDPADQEASESLLPKSEHAFTVAELVGLYHGKGPENNNIPI